MLPDASHTVISVIFRGTKDRTRKGSMWGCSVHSSILESTHGNLNPGCGRSLVMLVAFFPLKQNTTVALPSTNAAETIPRKNRWDGNCQRISKNGIHKWQKKEKTILKIIVWIILIIVGFCSAPLAIFKKTRGVVQREVWLTSQVPMLFFNAESGPLADVFFSQMAEDLKNGWAVIYSNICGGWKVPWSKILDETCGSFGWFEWI